MGTQTVFRAQGIFLLQPPPFSHLPPFPPVPVQQHSRLMRATQSWQGEAPLQKGLWTQPRWRQWRIQLGKNLTSPLPGRQAVCSPPMSWGWRCSGFCPLPSPKARLLPASWQDFVKATYFLIVLITEQQSCSGCHSTEQKSLPILAVSELEALSAQPRLFLFTPAHPESFLNQGEILHVDAHLSSPAITSCRRVMGVCWVWGGEGRARQGPQEESLGCPGEGQALRAQVRRCGQLPAPHEPGCHQHACLLRHRLGIG